MIWPMSDNTMSAVNTQRERTICIIHPNKAAYSETFIHAHIEHLPVNLIELYGGWLPRYQSGGKPLLSPISYCADRILSRFLDSYDGRLREKPLFRFLERSEVDAVLAEYGPTGVAVMQACHDVGVPLIVHFHGADAYADVVLQGYGRYYPELFDKAAAIIVVSRDMERQLLDLGAPREKLHYNPYGVDITLFNEADPGSALPLFVAVGRFVDKKAPQVTLLAFSRLVENVPEARLIMIGEGPLLESCKQLSHELEIAEAVEFYGSRPHAEVARTMQKARSFVQHSVRPSNGDSEGTPVAVLEAGASGLPVVATRHGGILDVVIDGQTGLLVDEGDALGMAQAMIQIAKNTVLAARLGRAARERIGNEFTMEKSINNLWSIIENVIDP